MARPALSASLPALGLTAVNLLFWCWSLSLALNSNGWLNQHPSPYDKFDDPGLLAKVLGLAPLVMIPASLAPLLLIARPDHGNPLRAAMGILAGGIVWFIVIGLLYFR